MKVTLVLVLAAVVALGSSSKLSAQDMEFDLQQMPNFNDWPKRNDELQDFIDRSSEINQDRGNIEELLKQHKLNVPEISQSDFSVVRPEEVSEIIVETQVEDAVEVFNWDFAPKLDLEIDQANEVVSQAMRVKRGEIDYREFYDNLDEETRDELYLVGIAPNLSLISPDFSVEQVRPGIDIGGSSAPGACKASVCGNPEEIVIAGLPIATINGRTGPICPVPEICSETLVGCAGEWCGYPVKNDIPLDKNNENSAITYQKNGYPETVFLGFFNLETNAPIEKCSAVIIHQNWVLSAMHCLDKSVLTKAKGTRFDFSKTFETSPSPIEGWSKMTVSKNSALGLHVVSHTLDQAALVEAVYVPYKVEEPVLATSAGVPEKDLMLVQLADNGLSYAPHQLPRVRKSPYATKNAAISFSGFGWTNVDGLSQKAWNKKIRSQTWFQLKQAAFNFVARVEKLGGSKNTLIIWNQGDLGGNGGPCFYDSGGPVYEGFNRGFWNDPRIVIGIVSGAYTTSGAKDVSACLGDNINVAAERIAVYAADICVLAENQPRGCLDN